MPHAPRLRLPAAVVALGLVSLFTDASSEMIVPLLPAFLTVQLGASVTFFGFVEGVAETVASLLKLASGAWSDRVRRRRPLVLTGYALSAIARPVVALCVLPWQVLVTRSVDRVGKGLRSAPRDALLAAATPAGSRGWAFGFHRAMDHGGAMIGALLAAGLLGLGLSVRSVFLWAAVPGLFAVITIVVAVKEQPGDMAHRCAERPSAIAPRHAPELLRYLGVLGIFTLANSSDAFLLLKAGEAGIPLALVPILWLVLHVTKAATNLAGGRLSDRIGPLPVIRAGWLVYGLVYALFGFATSPWQVWGLFAVYGLYHGLTEGAEKALVAHLAPSGGHGRAFGLYHALTGLLALPASFWMGMVWQHFGSRAAFLACAAISVLSVSLLWAMVGRASGQSRNPAAKE
jgi:MFS family permease